MKLQVFHRSLLLQGPAGKLEAQLWTSSTQQSAMAALVCHPHPLFGGTMHNKVVFQSAKSLQAAGFPVLRFNFRGVGLSEGTHDGGRGESDDVRAGLDYLAEEFSGIPILLAGFSFGALVGLRVGCIDTRVTRLIGLGLPVDKSDVSFLRECRKPVLFVHGGNDQFGSRANLEAAVADVPGPKKLVFVDGADHFFAGKLDQLDSAIREWIKED
ncbi:MAG: alpha/beta hydrolase [Acidobacteria bacterium]|nr:alpha/beta hydrolase [Acidobacteriota bacterium]